MFALNLNTLKWVLIALILAGVISVIPSTILIIFTTIIIFLMLLKSYQALILPLIILAYLTITSDYLKDFRTIVNLFSTIILLYIFLKKYGLKYLDYPKVPRGVIIFCLILFFTLFVSTIFSSFPLTSFAATFRMFLFMLISYMFYALIKNKNDIFLYLYSIICVMIIIGLPMIIDAYNLGLQRYFIRGILGNNLDLVSSLGYTGVTVFFISFSILIALFFIDTNKFAFSKIVLTVLLILNFFVLILANSRGGMLAAFISASFILFILNKKLFTKLTLSFILIAIVLLILLPEVSNIINLYLRWDTLEDREKYWQIGISMIKDHKIFGVGSDVFDKYFTSYASYSHLQSFKITSNVFGKPHPHNFFIFFTAENGILGFISAISFFMLFFGLAIKTLKKSKYIDKDFYVLSTVITGVGIGIFFRSFFEISGVLTYGYITRDLPFWILMVILIHIYFKILDEERILNSQILSGDR